MTDQLKPLKIIPFDPDKKKMELAQAAGPKVETADQKMYRVGQILFDKLSAIYSSPYFSSEDEIDRAVEVLVEALRKGVDPQLMLKKMKHLADKTDFKTKPHNPIIGKYWERDILPNVVSNIYDPKQNL